MIKRGKILKFLGSWSSGLATLIINDDKEGIVEIYCDNAPTVRALSNAFNDVIGSGHTVKENAGFLDKKIYYSVDEFNVLEGFIPVEIADDNIIKLYKEEGLIEK